MRFPESPYINQEDGALRSPGPVSGFHPWLPVFKEGESPEKILQSFPTLTLAQVYGAIAYYLDHKKLIDDHFAEIDREFERLVPPLSQSNPELFARLQAARDKMASKNS